MHENNIDLINKNIRYNSIFKDNCKKKQINKKQHFFRMVEKKVHNIFFPV